MNRWIINAKGLADMNGTMKAVRMYAPGDLRLEEVPVPKIRDNEVLIKVMAAGVCGSDIPRLNQLGAHISPIIPGHEFSGQVVETGSTVRNFKPGDRVAVPPMKPCMKCKYCEQGYYSLCNDYDYFGSRCDGAFSQYLAIPEFNLLRIPDNVTLEAAATMDPLANALHAVRRSGFKAGDKACVVGTGPIGLYIVQYLKANGASVVVGVDLGEEKRRAASLSGTDIFIEGTDEDAAEQIISATDGGADICIDASGSPLGQQNAVMGTAKQGTMVFLGMSHQSLSLSEHCLDQVLRGEKTLKGSWNSFTKPFPGWEWTHGMECMSSGIVDAEKIITHRLQLDELPEILRRMYHREFFFNKVLFLPWK
jgi:L-iditol 2-dehydrogenase